MLDDVVQLERHKLADRNFVQCCRREFHEQGLLALDQFLTDRALQRICDSAARARDQAYFCQQQHTVYLLPPDPEFPAEHIRNRQVTSTKGCICDDQVERDSPLRQLYDAPVFRQFVQQVTGQTALYPYADRLSSINIHYAETGQELGWHFDNSSFAITLLIQAPNVGGRFEFVRDLRNGPMDPWNFSGVNAVLEGEVDPELVAIQPGTLLLFRGRNSMHRVSPNEGKATRMMAVLAYNHEPGIALSENARLTFYGRLE
ncbi:MAG: hypothetical protein MK108_13345 [Mariniblastus sp.]|nr:hypothetical protein [Mariniblastus sp.]